MRNFSLGVGRRDLGLFAGAAIVAIVLALLWHLFLVDLIGNSIPYCQNNSQICNKYFLTFVIYALAFAVSAASLLLARRATGEMTRHNMIAGFLIRFGLALQIFGMLITPLGLYYATDPTRSVPVGFTAFSCVFLGVFLAGFGGNMVAPRRA
jgi:hypothetical protein